MKLGIYDVDFEHFTTEPIEEEVFENERFQPFRGWGHSWPGHFLPTDRVGHWSQRNVDPQNPVDASKFDNVAPILKQVKPYLDIYSVHLITP